MKLLIIDDNVEITDMLEKYLKLDGFDVTISNDGRNGLVLIKSGNFDKILLDLSMPEFTGVDILESLKKDGHLEKQKIIIFTASAIHQDEIDRLLEMGAQACVKKPVRVPELVKLLKT